MHTIAGKTVVVEEITPYTRGPRGELVRQDWEVVILPHEVRMFFPENTPPAIVAAVVLTAVERQSQRTSKAFPELAPYPLSKLPLFEKVLISDAKASRPAASA